MKYSSSIIKLNAVQRSIPYFLLLVALLAAFLVYRPGLSGPFVFDDGINIVNNEHLKIQDISLASLQEAAFSIPNGFFRRPLSMLSFALNYYLDAGKITPFPDAFSFKLTNLIIHLLNGIALFALIHLLVSAYRKRHQPDLPANYPTWLALAVSAAWLLHPLNLTSVLYVVQRMTSLSALFIMLGLIIYLWGRERLSTGRHGGIMAILVSLIVFTPLALLCKENGALLPFLMLSIELTLFRFETAQPTSRRALIFIFVACTALPVLAFIAYVAQHPEWVLAGYGKRDFLLSERLMTEARVIWFYLRLIVLPSNALMGMYHDDIAISRQLFDPITTLPAILGILALLASIWLLRKRQPLVAFGILFFLVGQSMESTFLPLELAHEHRNYLPMAGILLAFFHLLIEPFHTVDTKLIRRGVAILLISLFAVDTSSRAHTWGSPFDLWSSEADHHPASARANTELGDIYAFYGSITTDNPATKETSYLPARQYYEQAAAVNKNDVNGLFGLIGLSATHGKVVEKSWLNELAYRLESKAIDASVNSQLVTLARCKMQDTCTLTNDEIESLLNAPLRNPKVSGRDKALIYSALTYYFFNVTHNYPAAIEATHRSIELAPQELEFRVSLATILIAAKRFDEAREQILALKQLDKQGRLMQEITAFEKQLPQSS